MSERAVAIRLKIPDNEAYTAAVALRRLGVAVARIERSRIQIFDDRGNLSALRDRIERDEAIFNPNKHVLAVLDGLEPRSGEVWIKESAGSPDRFVGWRLLDAAGQPVAHDVTVAAAERLLCNPAIETALYREESMGRHRI